MKVELERVPGEPERYKVMMGEDDSEHGLLQCGIATRTGETSWAFAPRKGSPMQVDESIALTLQAKDADELRQVIATRFGVLELPADRLLDDTVEAFASNMLMPLSSLATSTHSIVGLIKALSKQVAIITVHDIHESKRTVFLDSFNERLREEVTELAADMERKRAMAHSMRSMLRETIDKLKGGADDDSGQLKH